MNDSNFSSSLQYCTHDLPSIPMGQILTCHSIIPTFNWKSLWNCLFWNLQVLVPASTSCSLDSTAVLHLSRIRKLNLDICELLILLVMNSLWLMMEQTFHWNVFIEVGCWSSGLYFELELQQLHSFVSVVVHLRVKRCPTSHHWVL